MSHRYMFGLTPAIRAGRTLGGGAFQTGREFLDYEVGGRRLLPRLGRLDVISVLATDAGPEELAEQARCLMMDVPAPLASGRRVLYCCPECGDLGCGGVTAVVERHEGSVVWRDIGWQSTVSDARRVASPSTRGRRSERNEHGRRPDVEPFPEIRRFDFDAVEYDAALRGLIARR